MAGGVLAEERWRPRKRAGSLATSGGWPGGYNPHCTGRSSGRAAAIPTAGKSRYRAGTTRDVPGRRWRESRSRLDELNRSARTHARRPRRPGGRRRRHSPAVRAQALQLLKEPARRRPPGAPNLLSEGRRRHRLRRPAVASRGRDHPRALRLRRRPCLPRRRTLRPPSAWRSSRSAAMAAARWRPAPTSISCSCCPTSRRPGASRSSSTCSTCCGTWASRSATPPATSTSASACRAPTSPSAPRSSKRASSGATRRSSTSCARASTARW